MSNSVKIVLGLALVTVAAACSREEPPMTYSEPAAPAPVQAEPTYSKY